MTAQIRKALFNLLAYVSGGLILLYFLYFAFVFLVWSD